MQLRKILLLILTFCFGAHLEASFASTHYQLSSYQELLAALERGDEVRAIIKINNCKVSKSNPLLETASGSLNFNAFSHYPLVENNTKRMTIATSSAMLVEHHVLGPIYGYARLRVFEDNSADFDNIFYDPKTFAEKGRIHYACHLNNDSVKLYDTNN